MTKRLEILIIENDEVVIHRSVSEIDEQANPYNAAIQAIVSELTYSKPVRVYPATQQVVVLPPPQNMSVAEKVEVQNAEFHPDLIKQGIAPRGIVKQGAIPVVNLDMKSIFKDIK